MTTPPRPDRSRPRHALPLPYLAATLLLALASAWPLRAAEPPLGPPLHDGFTYESPIHPGETFRFPVELQQGEFLRVEVDQIGIDVEVWLDDPEGKGIAHADSLSMVPIRDQTERLGAVASRTGQHVLRVVASASSDGTLSPLTRLRLRVSGPRPPSAADLSFRQAAELLLKGSEYFLKAKSSLNPEDFENASTTLDQASSLFRSLGERVALAYCTLWARGAQVQIRRGDWRSIALQLDEAAATLEQERSLDLRQQLEHALAYSALAMGYYEDWEGARTRIVRALALAEEVKDDAERPEIYHTLGHALAQLGRFEEAEAALKKSIQLSEASAHSGDPDPDKLALKLINLASLYSDWGRYQDAFAFYGLARRELAPGSSYAPLLANNFGELYGRLGENRKALDQYNHAAELFRKTGALADEVVATNNAAASYRFLGDAKKAQTLYEHAVVASKSAPETQALSLTNLAYLYVLDLHQPLRAVQLAQAAVAAAGPSKSREAWARHALALGLRMAKRLKQARRELETAIRLARSLQEKILEAEILLTLARVDRDEGKLDDARTHALQSVELVEAMRAGVRFNSTLRASFLAFRQAQYEIYVDTLMALSRAHPSGPYISQAFDASETTRARTLIESLANLPSRSKAGQPAEVREHLKVLSTRIGEAQVNRQEELARNGPDSSRAAELLEQIDSELIDYEAAASTYRERAGADIPQQARPLSLKEVQARVLGEDVLLLEYGLGKERSYLWAVSVHDIQAFRLPPRTAVEKIARRFYDLLTARNRHPAEESQQAYTARTRNADLQIRTVGKELSTILLQPIAPLLARKNLTLLVVTDGALHYIPFASLPLPGSGQPLVTRYRIVHLPSASALGALRQQFAEREAAPKELALFAAPTYRKKGAPLTGANLPPLPWAPREAHSIADLIPREDLLIAEGDRASRKTLEETDLSQYRNLHFATHGIVDSERPELSSLVLSQFDEQGQPQDGYLRLVDIYGLHLNAELVTLSACRTALGREIRGEGLVGLARGFMAAGAARVVASLWSVEDRATAELMANFYAAMLKDHLPVAEALRQAQLAMMRAPGKSAPYYWAAFTLQGEWK